MFIPDKNSLVNQWHLIVATMDSTAAIRAIYWDGKPAITETVPSTPNKTGAFAIGESPVFTAAFSMAALTKLRSGTAP
ncbi:MAG: LamG-like jellyroll fold domain-containing protein [Candidatus Acidiferrales bacterium]